MNPDLRQLYFDIYNNPLPGVSREVHTSFLKEVFKKNTFISRRISLKRKANFRSISVALNGRGRGTFKAPYQIGCMNNGIPSPAELNRGKSWSQQVMNGGAKGEEVRQNYRAWLLKKY